MMSCFMSVHTNACSDIKTNNVERKSEYKLNKMNFCIDLQNPNALAKGSSIRPKGPKESKKGAKLIKASLQALFFVKPRVEVTKVLYSYFLR